MKKKELVKLDHNVTNCCNFGGLCLHCCFRAGMCNLNDPSFEQLASIVRDFKQMGGKRSDITGGEPTIRKDIDKIIKLYKSLEIKTELVTNGSIVTVEQLKRYREWGLDQVAVSLDGSELESYRHIRRIPSAHIFKRVLRTIKESSLLGYFTKVNTVVFASNLEALPDICQRAIDLGAHEHGFYYFSPIGNGESSPLEVADPVRWLEIIRTKLWPLKDRIKLSIEVPIIEAELVERTGLDISCFMEDPWHLQILPHGGVYPCAIMSSYDRPIGNVNEKALSEIWMMSELRDGTYYYKNIEPLMREFGGCVNYPSFSHLIRSGRYRFMCLCKKFDIEELML